MNMQIILHKKLKKGTFNDYLKLLFRVIRKLLTEIHDYYIYQNF